MSNNSGLTQDLDASEEILLVKIALNPSASGEELKNELETSAEMFNSCVDKLLERGYVDMREEGKGTAWKVTELGRLALRKFVTVTKYNLMYADKIDESGEVINAINKRKLMFQRALKAAEGRASMREESE